ncbi:MAG: M48 family metallopeptidase [Candidatus Nanohaloarchaea archaeon]
MKTKIEGLKIPYEVRNSEEASKPRIDHKLGEFTVVIPEEMDLDPEELLNRKKNWVSKKRQEFLRFKRKIPDRNYAEGGKIEILGEKKEIIVEQRRSNKVGNEIRLAEHLVERTSLKEQLEKALRDKAREVIERNLEQYSSEISKDYNDIFIRDQETRWGSCSGKSNLNFNWRLIFGPEQVLEYVVVHELVHLEEKSHNEEFWSRVREIYPQYKEANRWLAEESSNLVFDKSLIEAS